MTFESVRSQVATMASVDFNNYQIEDKLNKAEDTIDLISLISSNIGLNEQEAINYIIQCI